MSLMVVFKNGCHDAVYFDKVVCHISWENTRVHYVLTIMLVSCKDVLGVECFSFPLPNENHIPLFTPLCACLGEGVLLGQHPWRPTLCSVCWSLYTYVGARTAQIYQDWLGGCPWIPWATLHDHSCKPFEIFQCGIQYMNSVQCVILVMLCTMSTGT